MPNSRNPSKSNSERGLELHVNLTDPTGPMIPHRTSPEDRPKEPPPPKRKPRSKKKR